VTNYECLAQRTAGLGSHIPRSKHSINATVRSTVPVLRKRESMSDPSDSTSIVDAGRASLSSPFLDFCANVRNSDPSILPAHGKPLRIRNLSEKAGIELSDALLEDTYVTYPYNWKRRSIRKALQRQWPSTCVPASACSEFAASEIGVENCSSEKRFSVVFYLHFKKVCRSRSYT
jgi:hypothetical protein